MFEAKKAKKLRSFSYCFDLANKGRGGLAAYVPMFENFIQRGTNFLQLFNYFLKNVNAELTTANQLAGREHSQSGVMEGIC